MPDLAENIGIASPRFGIVSFQGNGASNLLTPRLEVRIGRVAGGVPASPLHKHGRREAFVRAPAIGQTLQGSFSAVSKPNFARKYAFESSRRDLHNALLCTALKSSFSKIARILQD